ncbi:hypothetical protein DFJ77DRAFT_457846 [Powellomyces hirtus]|nr:hypothetical protein DFJ77DRAFT_457846 [Powellomyces hirtus]
MHLVAAFLPKFNMTPASLALLNVLCLPALAFVSFQLIRHLPPTSWTRRIGLSAICVSYMLLPLVFIHPSQPLRLVLATIPWLYVFRTIELIRNPVFASSVSGSKRIFIMFINTFIDRPNPYLDRDEIPKRFVVGVLRGTFKMGLFGLISALNSKWNMTTVWKQTSFLDPSRHAVALLMGFGIYLWMGAISDFVQAIAEAVLHIRTRDMFYEPFTSTSLRTLWAYKWNATVQDALANAVMKPQPAINISCAKKHDDPQQTERRPRASLLEILAIFVMSGLFHDHVSYCSFGELSLQTTAFFICQAAACLVEANLSRTEVYRQLPFPFKWLLVMTFLGLTAPLFVGPYIRNGGILTFPFPHFTP